jgi:GntR family transcriptional regulator
VVGYSEVIRAANLNKWNRQFTHGALVNFTFAQIHALSKDLSCNVLVDWYIILHVKRSANPDVFAFRLDPHSGVPVYRQLIDQVQAAIASGVLTVGDQLPTVRQVAVDLVINPNTVARAYREMEIRGTLDTQQGSGTFVADKKIEYSKAERERQLNRLVGEFVSRAGSSGFTVGQLIKALQELSPEMESRRR